jgi:Fe-S cluster assembly protein SufD
MLELAQTHDTYQADFDRLQGSDESTGGAPPWLIALRADAMEQFRILGWPGADNEDWRSTSVQPIVSADFSAPTPNHAHVPAAAIAPHRIPGAIELVFLNGCYRSDLSNVPLAAPGSANLHTDLTHKLPGGPGGPGVPGGPRVPGVPEPFPRAVAPGVRVLSLAEALVEDPVFVQAHLGRYAESNKDAFTALNTAFIHDGALIHLPADAALDAPIHLLFLASAGPSGASGDSGGSGGSGGGWVCHPRNLIIADPASRATIVEDYVALDEGAYWNNAVTELVVGGGSQVQYYLLEQDSAQAFHVATLRAVQAADSQLEVHTALFGAALARQNVHLELAGDDIHGLVNGLFVGRGRQHLDNHMRVVHAGLRGQSRQFYKGILDGQAQGVFTGRILVRPGAQQTDAKQTSRNLLLSAAARIDTRPQLEIYADDVKCTHGATTGRLDAAAAFYLQTRGLSPSAARALLIYAFARESLERMTLAPVRDRLERLLHDRLSALLDSPADPAPTRPILT